MADVLTGISAALELTTPDGAAVVVPTPAYPPFFDVIELTGRVPRQSPMVLEGGRWVLDLDSIDRHLRDGARAVLLCSPHNPTGRVFTPAELTALAEVVDTLHNGRNVDKNPLKLLVIYAGSVGMPLTLVKNPHAKP